MNNSKFSIESLEGSYGLHGSNKLIIFSGERLVVTNELSLLLQYCEVENVILKLVLDICMRIGTELGDHTMTAFIITSTLLSTLLKPDGMRYAKINHCSAFRSIRCIVQATHELQVQIEEMLFLAAGVADTTSIFSNSKNFYELDLQLFKNWCVGIWDHIIAPSSNKTISRDLCSVMYLWICSDSQGGCCSQEVLEIIRKKCDKVLKQPDVYILHSVHSNSLSDSSVLNDNEFLIDGRLLLSKDRKVDKKTSQSKSIILPYKFVCIRYLSAGASLNEVCEDENTKCDVSMEISNTSAGFENNSTLICTRLVEYLKAHTDQIDLVILSEKLNPETVTIFLSNGFHVVDSVSAKYYDNLTANLTDSNVIFGFDTAADFIRSCMQEATTEDACKIAIQAKGHYGFLKKFHKISLTGRAIDPPMVRLVGVCGTSDLPHADRIAQLVLCSGSNSVICNMYNRIILKCLRCMSNTIVAHFRGARTRNMLGSQVHVPRLVRGGGNVEMMWSLFMAEVSTLLSSFSSNEHKVGGQAAEARLLLNQEDCSRTQMARIYAQSIYSKLLNKSDVVHAVCVCSCISRSYENICVKLLWNRLNCISVHDNSRKLMTTLDYWRDSVKTGVMFHLDDMGPDVGHVDTNASRNCDSGGVCWYPLNSFWRIFYNALDSVGMLLKLGDSQHSIIHITGKKNQINHVEKGHSRSREVHLHPNTVASIRSSIYVSDNDEELSI